MKIVFIVPLLSQPRCIKRVKAISEAGYKCIVYGYNRGHYDCNQYPNGVEVHEFPQILKDGKGYFQKLKYYHQNIKSIVCRHISIDTLFYCFGFMNTLILKQYKRPYVYENSDILYGYPKFKGVQWLLKRIDKSIIKQSYLTVLTSYGFYEYFGMHNNNIIVQPNKVDSSLSILKRSILNESDGIKFGFIGAIRYESIFRFAEVIGRNFPVYEFHFYGASTPEVMTRCKSLSKEYPNIYTHGKFRNPNDLESIYNNIDVVVACYDTNSLNERIAEPNKLYEAILFCRPIVVSNKTFLAKRVSKYDCGFVIDASNEASIYDFIKKLDHDQLYRISEREYKLPKSIYVDSPSEILEYISNFRLHTR